MSEAKRKPRLTTGIKALVSLTILVATLFFLPLDEFVGAIKSVRLEHWLIILVAYLIRHFTSAWKWWILLGKDTQVPFSKAVRAYFWGLFANLYLPGVAGGDLVKTGLVARNTNQKTRIVVRSVADRILDIYSLLLVSLGGALFLIARDGQAAGWLVKLGLLGLPGVLGLFLIEPFARQFAKLPSFKAKDKLERGLWSIVEIKKRPGVLAMVIFVSTLGHVVFVGLNVALAQSSATGVSAGAWFFAWPLAKLLAVVPVTIAGIGVREGALAALLLPFGANPASIVAAGLLWQTIVFAGGLASGVISLVLDNWAVRNLKRNAIAKSSKSGAERIEILAYHSISNEAGPTSIPQEIFEGHLRILAEEQYAIIDFPELVEWREGKRELPSRVAILTFDDGFQDFADHAFPAIQSHGWHATVFLPTGCIGKEENWAGANAPARPIMSWETVKDLAAKGIRFGGHCVSHPDLTRLNGDQAEREIRLSIEAIEAMVGSPPGVFAPPYGRSNARIRKIIAKYCHTSVGTNLAAAKATSDWMNYPRIEMHYFRDLELWRAYLRGEAEFYFRFRIVLRKVREIVTSLVRLPRSKGPPSASVCTPA